VNLDELQAEFNADPTSSAYYQLTAGYVADGRLVEALVVMKKSVRYRPDDGVAARMLGWVLLAQNKISRAQAELTRSLQLAPGDHEARFLYALCCERQNEDREARTQIDYVLSADPTHAGALETLARLNERPTQDEPEEEEREKAIEKTIMMAAAEILASRPTRTAPSPSASTGERQKANEQAAAEDAAERQARAEELAARKVARERVKEMSNPQHRTDAPAADLNAEPIAVEIIKRRSPVPTLALAVGILLLLGILFKMLLPWSQQQKQILARFEATQTLALKDQPRHLMLALTEVDAILKMAPNHDKAIGLGAFLAMRLHLEHGWDGGPEKAAALLKIFPKEGRSIQRNIADSQLRLTQGDLSGATQAASFLTDDGRSLDLDGFKSARAAIAHAEGKNKQARKDFQSSLAGGAENRGLTLAFMRFELRAAGYRAVEAYADRLLAAADTATQDKKPSAALEIPPALIMRAAARLIQDNARPAAAIADLDRALALPSCASSEQPKRSNCLFPKFRLRAHGLRGAALQRLAQPAATQAATTAAGGAWISDWVVVAARARLALDAAAPDAAKLAASIDTLSPGSANRLVLAATAAARGLTGHPFELASALKQFPNLRSRFLLAEAQRLAQGGNLSAALRQIEAFEADHPTQSLRAGLLRVRVHRMAKANAEGLEVGNLVLQQTIERQTMSYGHAVLAEILRIEHARNSRSGTRKAYKAVLTDNPVHAETLFLGATLMNDKVARKRLLEKAPGTRWAVQVRALAP
jgi:hypothetical protein